MFFIIWRYLENKSPAMQTLKDEMVKEIIYAITLMSIITDVTMVCIGIGPIPIEIVTVIIYTRRAMAVYFFVQVLIAVIVKYLIIFHGRYLDLISDQTVVRWSRIICCIWAFWSIFYDMLTEDITESPILKAMLTGEDINMEDLKTYEVKNKNLINLLAIVDIIAILIVYAQIEFYKITDGNYTFGTLRKAVCGIIFFGLLIFFRLYSSFYNQMDKLIQYIIIQFFFVVVIPVLMIVNNDKILHSLRENFSCNNENIHSLVV